MPAGQPPRGAVPSVLEQDAVLSQPDLQQQGPQGPGGQQQGGQEGSH